MKRLILTLIITFWASLALAVDITDYPPANTSDWGPSIQKAVDDLRDPDGGKKWPDTSGGVIYFPKGLYTVRTGVIVRCPGIVITGEGTANSFACAIMWRNPDPTAALFTLLADKSDKTRRSHGFHMSHIKLFGHKSGVAIRFAEHDLYTRPFVFRSVGISYFTKAFEARRNCSGGLSCRNCRITYNGQVVDATRRYGADTWQGSINEVEFTHCLLSHNGLKSEGWPAAYALDFSGASNLSLRQCVLEQQPRALRVRKYQGIAVEGCRFEGNATSDDPVCLIEECRGVWFRANLHYLLASERKPDAPPTILLRNCEDHHVDRMQGKVVVQPEWKPVF